MSAENAGACGSCASAGRSKLLVLDFDGTMTDAEQEGAPYWKGYLTDLGILCGKPFEEMDAMARRLQAGVASHPNDNGWVVDGKIVAPAGVDPYLRMKPIAHAIFNHIGAFPSMQERSRVLEVLYKYNYEKTGTVFHKGARKALEALEGTNTFVVTNSYTEPVRKKLSILGSNPDGSSSLSWMHSRVHGLAKKYVLTDSFDAVPETMHMPGLNRPIYLRREKYYTVLTALLAQAGCGWQDLVVIGDIFELDLALPYTMGARVGLLANDHTPPYEREFLLRDDRGAVLESVAQIPEFAFGFGSHKRAIVEVSAGDEPEAKATKL